MHLLRLDHLGDIGECNVAKPNFGVVEIVFLTKRREDVAVNLLADHAESLALEAIDAVDRAGERDHQHHGVGDDQHGTRSRQFTASARAIASSASPAENAFTASRVLPLSITLRRTGALVAAMRAATADMNRGT